MIFSTAIIFLTFLAFRGASSFPHCVHCVDENLGLKDTYIRMYNYSFLVHSVSKLSRGHSDGRTYRRYKRYYMCSLFTTEP